MPTASATRPLFVVYVVSLFPCWSETFISREIHTLLRRGLRIRILSLKHPSERLVHAEALQLKALVSYPPRFIPSAARVTREVIDNPLTQARLVTQLITSLFSQPTALAKALVTWWRTLAMARELRLDPPDWLHAHWATYPSTATLVLAETLGIPFSFTSHAHDIFVENQLLDQKLRRAAFAVTISEFNRKTLAERFGEGAVQRLHVSHCGVRLDEFTYKPDGRSGNAILAVGRLEEIKGFQHLIAACRILRARNVRLSCDIVGDGTQRLHLERLIVENGLGDTVRLRGAMDQRAVRELLDHATVFALPCVVSRRGDRDGIPVVLMEAMAVGLPVVSTPVSGIPELVVDGVTGLLTEPGSPAALADAIQRLLEDPDLCRRLVAGARRQIDASFDLECETDRLLRLFRGGVGATQGLVG